MRGSGELDDLNRPRQRRLGFGFFKSEAKEANISKLERVSITSSDDVEIRSNSSKLSTKSGAGMRLERSFSMLTANGFVKGVKSFRSSLRFKRSGNKLSIMRMQSQTSYVESVTVTSTTASNPGSKNFTASSLIDQCLPLHADPIYAFEKRYEDEIDRELRVVEEHSAIFRSMPDEQNKNLPWVDFMAIKAKELSAIKTKIEYKFHYIPNANDPESGGNSIQLPKPAFPGCTTCEVSEPQLLSLDNLESVMTKEENMHRAAASGYGDPRVANLRSGLNYKKNKLKANSGLAIYDFVCFDCFESPCKVLDIAKYIELPAAKELDPATGLPKYLILNVLAPLYRPINPLFSDRKKDGKGLVMIYIYALSDFARNNSKDPSIVLLKEFMAATQRFEASGKTSNLDREMVNRLKNIVTVLNINYLGLSKLETTLLPRYNKTPWLIRWFLTHYILSKEKSTFEIVVDLHSFRYTTLQLVYMILPRIGPSVVDTTMVIEARNDEEMPERVLCTTRMFNTKVDGSPKLVLFPHHHTHHVNTTQFKEMINSTTSEACTTNVQSPEVVFQEDKTKVTKNHEMTLAIQRLKAADSTNEEKLGISKIMDVRGDRSDFICDYFSKPFAVTGLIGVALSASYLLYNEY